MADIGYYEQIEGGIYGTGNPATDPSPESRAALQEASTQRMLLKTTVPGYVPNGYGGAGNPLGINAPGGGAQAKIGWTAQKDAGTPAFPPYTPTGRIPDWEANGIPLTGGQYDMTEDVAATPVNPLNRAPIGGGSFFEGYESTPPNPNAPTTDVSGQIEMEY